MRSGRPEIIFFADEPIRKNPQVIAAVLEVIFGFCIERRFPLLDQLGWAQKEKHVAYVEDRECLVRCMGPQGQGVVLPYAAEEVRGAFSFMEEMVCKNPLNFAWASEQLQTNRDFVQACILRNWRVLISCSALFKEDAELVSLAIEQGSYQAIGCVSETVQEANDFALVKQAIRKDPRAVKLVCPSAKKDEQVARLVAELGGSILHLDECWRSHKETVVTAIRNAVKKNTGVYFENLCGAEEVVRMDEEIVRCLIDVVRTSEQIKTQKKTAFLADLRCVQQAGKIAQSVEIPECFSD